MNKENKGFTLLEMLVALGLSIVIIVMIARVFVICANVTDLALTSSSFYLKLARLHFWVAEGFHEQDLEKNLSEDYCDLWDVRASGFDGVNDAILKGSEDGEGVLMESVKAFSIEDTIQIQYPVGPYLYPELHILRLDAYYVSRSQDVQINGPESTSLVNVRMFFNKWVLYQDIPDDNPVPK